MADVATASPTPAPAPTATTTTDDATLVQDMKKAAAQVEFYFADANLPFDKFMWTLHSKDPAHWVPIQTVASFKRMREYGARGVEWVANAIRANNASGFLEVDETGTKVRRTTEVKEPKGQHERSVYAKGFGDEDETLLPRLEAFFATYGPVNAVRLRRDEKKKFKGSVFTEFRDFESVDAFLKADPKPTWDGNELLIMSKEDYCQMKIKEKGLTGKAAIHRRELISGTGFNAFKLSSSSSSNKKDNGTGTGKEEEKKDVFLDFLGHKLLIKQDEEGNGTVEEKDIPFVRGVTLKFVGCGGDVKWPEIKDPIKAKFDGRAPYIKYSRGDDSGLVGFYKPLTEEEIQYVRDTIKTINEHEVTWELAGEEEEKQFEIERAKAAAKNAFNQASFKDSRHSSGGRGGSRGRGNRGRGGRGGRGGGRGGRHGASSDSREKKKTDDSAGGDGVVGEKRKRAVEPDGGPDVGVRGNNAPPTVGTSSAGAAKKAKTDGGDV